MMKLQHKRKERTTAEQQGQKQQQTAASFI